jgi:hypothetical protein
MTNLTKSGSMEISDLLDSDELPSDDELLELDDSLDVKLVSML